MNNKHTQMIDKTFVNKINQLRRENNLKPVPPDYILMLIDKYPFEHKHLVVDNPEFQEMLTSLPVNQLKFLAMSRCGCN